MILHHNGIRRSGTHAVTEWVLRHFDGVTGLNNSVQSCPLRTFKLTHLFIDGDDAPEDIRKGAKLLDQGTDRYEKDHMVLTYEDWYEKMTLDQWIEATREESDVLRSYSPIIHVVTLRSFYNMVASRIRQSERARGRSGGWRASAVEGWIEMAEDYFHNEGLYVLYDFIGDSDYRDRKRQELGLPEDHAERADEGLQRIAHKKYGGVGSSFDLNDLDGAASRMKTETRWQGYVTHPIMAEVLQNDRARELNMELFGWTLDSNGKLQS